MIEQYKKIKGFSNYRIYNNGSIYSEFVNRYVTATEDSCGYLQNTLVDDKGNRKTIKNHRLVALAFLPNPENLPDVNHKDFNRKNNNVSNLEWCTEKYNTEYTAKFNMDNNSNSYMKLSPLSEEQVLLIPTLLNYGFSVKLISKLYNVGHITIRNIITGKTWKWLRLNFNRESFIRDIIEIPDELYNELIKVGVDNTVLNDRIKKLSSV
jgi:hypothetical protein